MPLRFIAVSLLMFSCFTATPSQIRQPKFEDFKREMMPQVGQRITIVGILQTGKLGWWVAFKDWGVYIHATNGSDFAKMSNLSSFDGKTVEVSGTLRYFAETESATTVLPVAVPPEHFYFDIAEVKVLRAPPIHRDTSKQSVASIREIDFANFRYAGTIGRFPAGYGPTKAFTLKGGKVGDWRDGFTLRKIVFGDVTGDGIEEAIITLDVNTDGNAGVDQVYIYGLKFNRPRFLWGFEGGDRADGGLRQAYAENGQLVIELWGRGTQIGGYIGSTESVGLCCPKSFTRTRYHFRNGRFMKRGKMEILENPAFKTNCPTCMPK